MCKAMDFHCKALKATLSSHTVGYFRLNGSNQRYILRFNQETSSNLVKVAENGQKLVDVNRERPLMTATEKYARNCKADQPLVLLQCFKKEAMLDFKIIFHQLDTLIFEIKQVQHFYV